MENDLYNDGDASERTVVSTRLFDTNVLQMFDAWTNPVKLAKWWGPKGFTNTFDEFNPTPGGRWVFTMHGPNGSDYKNECEFFKVDHAGIILFHIPWPKFKLTATFEEVGKQIKLTFSQEFISLEDYDKVAPVAIPSNEENFDRLEAVLANN